jgi:hypothetical protein
VPLHRRLLYQRAAIGHWLVVAALVVVTTSVVDRLLQEAAAAQARWGATRPVLVTTRPVAGGQPLAGVVRVERRPRAVVPPQALDVVAPDARAAAAIGPGEVITAVRVAGRTAGAGASTWGAPRGRRVVALPAAHAPLAVAVGDRVDVWATFDPALAPQGVEPTALVAAGALVVATHGDVVTVAVDPADTRPVAHAAAVGSVTLVGVPGGQD